MRLLFLLVLLVLPLFGTSTTVADTIKLADGTTPNGKLYIEFPFSCFDSAGSPIAHTYKPVTVTSGAFSVTLVSNEDCVGTYYNVTYDLRYGKEDEVHKWIVPDSGPVDIEDVQSDGVASTTNASVADRVQVNGSDVTNINLVDSASITFSVDTDASPNEATAVTTGVSKTCAAGVASMTVVSGIITALTCN